MVHFMGKQGRYLMDIDFLGFWCVIDLYQEVEGETFFGTMRLAHSILETSFYGLQSI